MIYMTVLEECSARTSSSQEPDNVSTQILKEGESFRGWVVGNADGKLVFLTGSCEYYEVAAESIQLSMRGDNPILEGRVSPTSRDDDKLISDPE
jgi:hypothetical protein